jgi:hypothetical protein
MKLKKKRYLAECKRCRQVKKMEVVGVSDDEKYAWLRCHGCHMVYLFPVEWFQQNDKVVAPPEVLRQAPTQAETHQVVEYSLNKTFSLGQRIYHKAFNDVGEVISKRKMDHGSKIVVAFKRCGEKTLVEGLTPA